jgi:hypothetical protein
MRVTIMENESNRLRRAGEPHGEARYEMPAVRDMTAFDPRK